MKTMIIVPYEFSCQKVKVTGRKVAQCGNISIAKVNNQRLCHNCLKEVAQIKED